MPRPSYLMKRGNIFWWRRRPPSSLRLREAHRARYSGAEAPSTISSATGHLAVSLRTSCPREARWRAAGVSALFEYGWQQFEHAMNQHAPGHDATDFQQVFAQQLLEILRANVEQATRLSEQFLPAPQHNAAQHAIDSASRRQIVKAVPVPPAGKQQSSSLNDPEFEAALVELADREG